MAKSNTVLIIVLLGVIGFCGCIIVLMCVVGVVCKLKPINESNGIESNDDISKSNENNKHPSENKSLSFNMNPKGIADMLENPNRDNNVTHSDHSQITSSDNDYIKANKFTTSSSNNTFAHLVQNEQGWGSSNNNIYNNNSAGASNKNNNNKPNNKNHRSTIMPRVLQHINPDNIQFENMIGKGKSAKVFKGKWGNKIVAVKWFRQEEVEEKYFERELKIANNLTLNRNVVRIYGYTMSPYALVTEFLNGQSVEITLSLKHKNSLRKDLYLIDLVKMLIDAGNGIKHLHNNGIVHRDISARNLMCDYDSNNNLRVVVCDFGLSRITQSIHDTNYTTTTIGPIKWMSPESIQKQKYNSMSDVYSFGIMIWEMLAGIPPYSTLKVVNVAVKVIYENVRPIILSWFPMILSVLMQRCWQLNDIKRPTFDTILIELKEYYNYLNKLKRKNLNNIDKLYMWNDKELINSFERMKEYNDIMKIYDNNNFKFKNDFDKEFYINFARNDMQKISDKLNNNNTIINVNINSIVTNNSEMLLYDTEVEDGEGNHTNNTGNKPSLKINDSISIQDKTHAKFNTSMEFITENGPNNDNNNSNNNNDDDTPVPTKEVMIGHSTSIKDKIRTQSIVVDFEGSIKKQHEHMESVHI